MNPLFPYLFKASVSLSIFYLAYTLVYKREAHFHFNRAFLLFALLFSTLLPFFSFSVFGFPESAMQSPEEMLFASSIPAVQINEVVGDGTEGVQNSLSFISLLVYIYFVVVILKSIQFSLRLFQIEKITGKYKSIYKDGIRFVLTTNGLPVFSFFNRIFIDEDMFGKKDAASIIQHEKVHITHFHSVDLLLAEIVCILQWFNPFAYLLKKAIKENHEFIADQKMVSHQPDAGAYRLLLMEYATPIKTNVLTHNFSYSLLKRRLSMIKKRKSMMRFAFNLFWLLPVLMLVLFACSSPKGEEDMLGVETMGIKDLQDRDPDSYSVKLIVSEDGDTTFLISNEDGRYLTLDLLGASGPFKEELLAKAVEHEKLQNIDPDSVSVKVIVDEKEDVYFFLYLGKERYLKFDVYNRNSSFKKTLADINWEPGEVVIVWHPHKEGITKPGVYDYKLEADHDIVLKGSFAIKATSPEKTSIVSDEIFQVVEQQPEFPGGMSKLSEYLSESVSYPEQAKHDSIQGRVFVGFIIEKDGSISTVKLLRGIGGGCDEEAMRVVAEMPNWKPGVQRDQAVRVQYTLPIKFTLK